MKCVAVGDMMIPSIYFRRELEKSSIIDEFICKSWKENSSKDDFREVIRKIETQGACAFEIEDEITELMKKADVIFVHQCPVSKEVIKEAENLKYILSCRGGVENIDMEAAKEKGVKVINCPAHNAYAVAEYTIGMILNELRNITRSCTALKNGEWREKYQNSETLTELRSQTIGIIGFGTIGRLVIERLKGFHPTILVHDPFADEDKIREEGCKPVTKEELIKRSDVITIHARIKAGDPPIIGKEEFNQMKETVLKEIDSIFHEVIHADYVISPALYKTTCRGIVPVTGRINISLEKEDYPEPIKCPNIAPGIQLFIILQRLLEEGKLKSKSILIIENPDAYLDPELQVKFAELLVLLREKMGIYIVLTTHSHYLIDALDLFSVKYGISDQTDFYFMEKKDEKVTVENVNDNMERIYRESADVVQYLESLRYEVNHD